MANMKIETVPFSEMDETVTPGVVTERTFDSSYEAPYSYEADEDMLQALAQRYEYDMWTASFARRDS